MLNKITMIVRYAIFIFTMFGCGREDVNSFYSAPKNIPTSNDTTTPSIPSFSTNVVIPSVTPSPSVAPSPTPSPVCKKHCKHKKDKNN